MTDEFTSYENGPPPQEQPNDNNEPSNIVPFPRREGTDRPSIQPDRRMSMRQYMQQRFEKGEKIPEWYLRLMSKEGRETFYATPAHAPEEPPTIPRDVSKEELPWALRMRSEGALLTLLQFCDEQGGTYNGYTRAQIELALMYCRK